MKEDMEAEEYDVKPNEETDSSYEDDAHMAFYSENL